MTTQLKARVAEIIDDSTVALNVGSVDGVQKGDQAIVWREVTITDPESGELLGQTRVAALRLRVVIVDERFCVAATQLSSGFTIGKRTRIANARGGGDSVLISVGDAATVDLVPPEELL